MLPPHVYFAALQYDIAWEDKAANHEAMASMLADAGLPARTFVLLPELGDTGFSFDLDRIVDDRTLPWATDLARRLNVWLQVGHAERGPNGRGRNRATIVAPDGTIAGTYEKVHPFSFGREIEHFDGGGRMLIRRCDEGEICPLVCYDLRFPELYRLAARPPDGGAAAEIYTLGASWPNARQSHWRALHIARAIENQAYVVAANRVGADPQMDYDGGSMIVAPSGAVLAEAGDGPAVIQADLDLDALRVWRRDFPALADVRTDLLGTIEITRA
ncbi:MAG: carbon-nitrogen family hydrolase [Planctomycetes bacterium]|nr:carbon-nitrogen family hydrolase [Planctomycetota bacterium]